MGIILLWGVLGPSIHYLPAPLVEFCCRPEAPCLFSDSTNLCVSGLSASHPIPLVLDSQKLLRDTLYILIVSSNTELRPGSFVGITNFKSFKMRNKTHIPTINRHSLLVFITYNLPAWCNQPFKSWTLPVCPALVQPAFEDFALYEQLGRSPH